MTEKVSNAALREELEKLKRYRTSIIAGEGRASYDGKLDCIVRLMKERGLFDPAEHGTLQGPRCTLKPLADNVVVLPDKEADVTAGGIIKPESAKAVPSQGEVLAVGPGMLLDTGTLPLSVQVGDRVLFGRYSGLEFVLDGETVLIMPERDILGVLG